MGTVTTPAEYQYICDGCGKETDQSPDAPVPEGWETWSRFVTGKSGVSILLCNTCGPSKATSVGIVSFENVPEPPPPA